MSTILYGIPNCDTIKKAKKWLADNDIAFTFHDYRKDGIDNDFLVRAESELGWEAMLNKRGTTFRQLEEQEKANLDKDKALASLFMTTRFILASNPRSMRKYFVKRLCY